MTATPPDRPGKVYLVGAGPGAVDYLTVRGYRLLQFAEVLVHDALVDEAVLDLLPGSAIALMWANAAATPALPRQTLTNSLFTSASRVSK
jgi:siroheme synthase